MPTSVPGSKPARRASRSQGFTLLELLVVITIIALSVGLAAIALREGPQTRLERDAVRLASLLEAARVEARSQGMAVSWEPVGPLPAGAGAGSVTATMSSYGAATDTSPATPDMQFRFLGLPLRRGEPWPTRWLTPEVQAQVAGARALLLGPEPIIGPQKVVLFLEQYRIAVATDGLAPFSVQPEGP